jgi:hypothetical protein
MKKSCCRCAKVVQGSPPSRPTPKGFTGASLLGAHPELEIPAPTCRSIASTDLGTCGTEVEPIDDRALGGSNVHASPPFTEAAVIKARGASLYSRPDWFDVTLKPRDMARSLRLSETAGEDCSWTLADFAPTPERTSAVVLEKRLAPGEPCELSGPCLAACGEEVRGR